MLNNAKYAHQQYCTVPNTPPSSAIQYQIRPQQCLQYQIQLLVVQCQIRPQQCCIDTVSNIPYTSVTPPLRSPNAHQKRVICSRSATLNLILALGFEKAVCFLLHKYAPSTITVRYATVCSHGSCRMSRSEELLRCFADTSVKPHYPWFVFYSGHSLI